jgi:hypothetical protein
MFAVVRFAVWCRCECGVGHVSLDHAHAGAVVVVEVVPIQPTIIYTAVTAYFGG